MTHAVVHRALTLLTVLLVWPLVSSAVASATPTITYVKVAAVPMPGFPGTGDVRGAGAAILGETAVSGTEYDGSPPPVIALKFYAPAGTKLHSQGFATCAPSVLEQLGPAACPKRSIAGPKGSALGSVTFGGERVPETASVQPFFAPGGDLEGFIDGTTPALFEILAKAHVIGSAPPFGVEVSGEIPLIETVPGAPDASFERGAVEVGAAFKQGGKTISYITMPERCPTGGFPVKEEVGFLGGATVTASSTMPCPRK